MRRASLRRAVLVSLACFGTVAPTACKHHRRHAPIARGGGPVAPHDLDDAAIAGLVGAVHTALIEQAEVAQDRGDDDGVKLFADRVLARHAQLGQWANVEFERIHLDPRETGQSRAIVDDSAATMRSLSSKMADEFDRSYIEAQVRLLERAVHLYESGLATAAHDPEVRAVVNRDREVLRAQLAEATALRGRAPGRVDRVSSPVSLP